MDCSVPDVQDKVISTGPSTSASSDTSDRTLTDSERSTVMRAIPPIACWKKYGLQSPPLSRIDPKPRRVAVT